VNGARQPIGGHQARGVGGVLVTGSPASVAALVAALSDDHVEVVELAEVADAATAAGGQAGLVAEGTARLGGRIGAAFALDVGPDFDSDGWAAAVHEADPDVPVAFAWARGSVPPTSLAWATQCRGWLERTYDRRRGDAAPPLEERELDLPSSTTAAAAARGLLRELGLHQGSALQEAAALAVSELATNAALHGRPPLHLRATVSEDAVYLGVEDRGSGSLPRRREASGFDEAGRGLSIVAAVADWWGVTVRPGRVLVWCGLDR